MCPRLEWSGRQLVVRLAHLWYVAGADLPQHDAQRIDVHLLGGPAAQTVSGRECALSETRSIADVLRLVQYCCAHCSEHGLPTFPPGGPLAPRRTGYQKPGTAQKHISRYLAASALMHS